LEQELNEAGSEVIYNGPGKVLRETRKRDKMRQRESESVKVKKDIKTKDLGFPTEQDGIDMDQIYSQKQGQNVIITNNNINNYIISNPKIEVTTNVPQHALVATAAAVVNFP
jgi:hypothetical protein